MTTLNPSMRLKVKEDTYFLPDPNGGVYFRNNMVSFRLEGATIYPWIEKLMPMFNGEHTLGDLTEGLPDPYRNRLNEIAGVLYQNGFVRDVSQDIPFQLPDEVLKKYAYQIEFLESFGDSGAYRFQSYRQAKVLAVGSGPLLTSLAAALFESGLSKFHLLITDSVPTNRQRLMELAEFARRTDPESDLEEIILQKEGGGSWRKVVQPYESILYVSQEGDIEELRLLQSVCREEKKMLLPAIFVRQAGLAGPLVHPDSEACWESAWRSLHQSAICKDAQLHTFSSTAGALLTNVIVFELLKAVTGVTESELKSKVFLLNLETLEGNWHSFKPHPLVTGRATAKWVQDFDLRLERSSGKGKANRLLPYFGSVTSAELGIFQCWEEGDLSQLPLAQCRVRTADPLSEGPAELLPDIVSNELTHEEARREAGLSGIEAYISRMNGLLVTKLNSHPEAKVSRIEPHEFVGIGAGETFAESLCRGLHKCLADELGKRLTDRKPTIQRVQLSAVKDERCRFYLQALTLMQGEPAIGFGEDVSGFPVIWVGTGGGWFGSAGLNRTLALRKVLQQALLKAQNETDRFMPRAFEVSSVFLEDKDSPSLVIYESEDSSPSEVILPALQILKWNHKRLLVFGIELEPFKEEETVDVFGMLLREEESR